MNISSSSLSDIIHAFRYISSLGNPSDPRLCVTRPNLVPEGRTVKTLARSSEIATNYTPVEITVWNGGDSEAARR